MIRHSFNSILGTIWMICCYIMKLVELIFLYPWAVVAKKVGWFALVEVIVFFFILFMGFLYAHKKGALKWV